MSHFALLWKARTIEIYRQNYENEKLNSIIKSNADIPEKTLHQRWKHYSHDLHKRLSRTFSQWAPEGSTISNFYINLRAEMRFSKILLRSLFGFVGGLVLTYLCFVFLVFQLSLSLVNATVISSLFGMLITVGLTFNNRMRCLVFLLIPQLFSRAGRYTLTCYALVLILTGPATNIFKNSEVLSESMACSQEQIKTTVRDINESVKKPYNSMKDSIKLMVETSKRISSSLRSSILRVNRLALSVASIIQSSFSWLTTMAESCHKRLGTPYDRCISTINRGTVEVLPENDWYTIASMGKISCGILKGYKTFCVATDYAEETFFATIKRKLKTFTARLNKSIFFVITAQHSYSIVGNSSSNQVAAGIVTEIRNRADPILTWLSWSSCVTSLFLMLILFRAHHYQHMFETRFRFDNRYITREFRELDLSRLRESRETVLPLSTRERAKYVTTTSFRLVASEKTYLNRSAVFMIITTFKLLVHIVADYSLYWLLTTIRHHGSLQASLEAGSSTTGAHISGKGFVSRLLQSLIDTMNIPLNSSTSKSKDCLPNPLVPDFQRYSQIGTLICAQWFFALFEPYGLRLCHLIVGHYNPDRAKARAVWLYNHILRHRGSFMKSARRKLHREYKYYSKNNMAARQRFRHLVPFKWLRLLLGIQLEEDKCLLCNVFDVRDVNSDLIRCEVLDCPGIYCKSCFSDIGQMCTICLSPADYGDLSDVSLEMGSSNEDSDRDDNDDAGANSNINEEHGNEDKDYTKSQCYNDETDDNNDDKSDDSSSSKYSYEMFPLLHHQGDVWYDKDDENDKTNKNENKTCLKTNNNTGLHNIEVHCIGILKQITIDVCVEKFCMTNPYVFYGFYEIRMQNSSLCIHKDSSSHSFLGSRKFRTRKKNSSLNILRLVTCINNNGGEPQRVKNCPEKGNITEGDGRKDNKGNNNRKRRSLDKINKIIKGNGTKKPKNNKQPTGSSTNINSNSRIVSKWSRYWKNISSALSCTKVMSTTKFDDNERSKHKRKKKRKELRIRKIRANNEATMQYRILTYFADQDWRRNKLMKKIKDSFESQTKISATDEIEVNFIKVPKLNLTDFSNEESNEIFEGQSFVNKDEKIVMHSNILDNIFPGIKRNYTATTVETIFRGLNNPSTGQNTPIKYSDTATSLTEEIRIAKCAVDDDMDISLPRSMRFFQSVGNVFEQLDHQDSILKSNCPHNSLKPKQKPKTKNKFVQQNSDAPTKTANKSKSIMSKTTRQKVSITNVMSNKETQVKTKKMSASSLVQKISKRNTKGLPCSCGCKCPMSLLRDLYSNLFHCQRNNVCVEDEEENTEKKERFTRPRTQTREKEIDRGISVKIDPYPMEERCQDIVSKREIEKKEVTQVKSKSPTIEEVSEVKKNREFKSNTKHSKVNKAKVVEKISDHKIVIDIKDIEHLAKEDIIEDITEDIKQHNKEEEIKEYKKEEVSTEDVKEEEISKEDIKKEHIEQPAPPPRKPPKPVCPPPPCPPRPCSPPPCSPPRKSGCSPPRKPACSPPRKPACSPPRKRTARRSTNTTSKQNPRESCLCSAPPLSMLLPKPCKCPEKKSAIKVDCKCNEAVAAVIGKISCKCSDLKPLFKTPTSAEAAVKCKCSDVKTSSAAGAIKCKCTEVKIKTSSKTNCKCIETPLEGLTPPPPISCKCKEPVKEKKKKKTKGAATANSVNNSCQATDGPGPSVCQPKPQPKTCRPKRVCQPKTTCRPSPICQPATRHNRGHDQGECKHLSQQILDAVNRSKCRKHCRPRTVMVCDAEVNAYAKQTCTCATQHVISKRDIGTYDNYDIHNLYIQEDKSIKPQRSTSYEQQAATTSTTNATTDETPTFSQDSEETETESETTAKTDETRTDTTLTVLPVDYRNMRTLIDLNEKKKVKVAVITKTNQSTTTEKAIYCDASTVTQDWWSPILEKKVIRKDYMNEGYPIRAIKKDNRPLKDMGITAEGRIVTFKSRAQIIPRESFRMMDDILSPSRYLLESQKYYNELFNTKFYSPHVFPVTLKHQMLEPRSPVNSRQGRRSRITKRREDGYPCKKQTSRRRCR